MSDWAVVLTPERYSAERLFAREGVDVGPGPAPGDRVLLIADDVLFGLATVRDDGSAHYTHRMLDAPLPYDGPVGRLAADTYAAWADRVGADLRVDGPKQTWLVSLDLPIEAASPAEAVRAFWSYVTDLGPAELPAYVSPSADELSMQAFVLGAEANLDPEEDD